MIAPPSHFVTNPDVISAHSFDERLLSVSRRDEQRRHRSTGLHGTNSSAPQAAPERPDADAHDVAARPRWTSPPTSRSRSRSRTAGTPGGEDPGHAHDDVSRQSRSLSQTKTIAADRARAGRRPSPSRTSAAAVAFGAQRHRERRRRQGARARRTSRNNHASYPVFFSLPLGRLAVDFSVAALDRDRGGGRRGRRARARAGRSRLALRRVRGCAAHAARRRRRRPRRLRRLAPGPDRRASTAPSTTSRRRSRASTAASTRRSRGTAIVRYDAYENTGGHQSASVALLDASRSGVVLTRDPGPRLRADLRQGARPRPRRRLPLARGAGGSRARHEVAGEVAQLRSLLLFAAGCSTFSS